MVAQWGIEPQTSDYETDVIPFHYRATSGRGETRTLIILRVKQLFSQLNYTPMRLSTNDSIQNVDRSTPDEDRTRVGRIESPTAKPTQHRGITRQILALPKHNLVAVSDFCALERRDLNPLTLGSQPSGAPYCLHSTLSR